MSNKAVHISACISLLVASITFLLMPPATHAEAKNIFIAADTDSFDPGLPVGEHFPAIKALYEGRTVSDVREFAHHKGMIFIANRSADW